MNQDFEQAIQLARDGDRAQARDLLLALVERQPDNLDAWKWLATVAVTQQEAYWAIEKALALDPSDEWAVRTRHLLDGEGDAPQDDIPLPRRQRRLALSTTDWRVVAGTLALFILVAAVPLGLILARARGGNADPTPTPETGSSTTPVPIVADVTLLPPTWTPSPTLTSLPTVTASATFTQPPPAATNVPPTSIPPTATLPPTATATVPTATPTETEVPVSSWPAERVVIISVDGLRPDGVTPGSTPNILGLADRGSFSWTAQTVRPSNTLPAHASMLSGVDVATHGISWNAYVPSNGFISVPTVFSASNNLDGHTIMVIGLDRLNHIAAPGTVDEVLDMTGGSDWLIASAAADAMLDIPGFDVMFVHLPNVDRTGHNFGWQSGTYFTATTTADSAIGNLLAQIDAAGWTDTTTVIITSDHGGEGDTHTANIPENTTIPWVIAGPGVRPNVELFGVNVMDTAPTALYAIDVPVPGGMQGRIVFEAFE